MRSLLIVTVLVLSACVSEPLPEGFKGSDDFDQVAAAKNRISLGLTYLQNGNYSQAKFNLDKALQFAPRLADAHYSIAFYYQQVGEIERADESYQRALDFEPRNADIANSYGAFLCQNGQYDNAKKYFLKAVNSSNYISSAETYENLALCSQSQGQIDDALTYAQNALNHQPSRAKSLLLLVELQMQQRQWQQAKDNLRRYEKVARVTPETLWLAITLEREMNNIKLAKGYGDMLIRMYPAHPRTIEYVKTRNEFTKMDASGKVLRQLKPSAAIVEVVPANDPEVEVVKAEPEIKPVTSVKKDMVETAVDEPKLAVQTEQAGQNVVEPVAQNSPSEQPKAEEQPLTKIENEMDSEINGDRKIADPVERESELVVQQAAESVDSASATVSLPEVAEVDTTQNETTPRENTEAESTLVESTQNVTEQTASDVSNERNSDDIAQAEVLDEETLEDSVTQPAYHTVLKGENLYRISLKYNVKMKSIMEWNDLEEGQAILVGMKLIVTEPMSVEQ